MSAVKTLGYYPGTTDMTLSSSLTQTLEKSYGAQELGRKVLTNESISSNCYQEISPSLTYQSWSYYARHLVLPKDPVNMLGYAALNISKVSATIFNGTKLEDELAKGRNS